MENINDLDGVQKLLASDDIFEQSKLLNGVNSRLDFMNKIAQPAITTSAAFLAQSYFDKINSFNPMSGTIADIMAKSTYSHHYNTGLGMSSDAMLGSVGNMMAKSTYSHQYNTALGMSSDAMLGAVGNMMAKSTYSHQYNTALGISSNAMSGAVGNIMAKSIFGHDYNMALGASEKYSISALAMFSDARREMYTEKTGDLAIATGISKLSHSIFEASRHLKEIANPHSINGIAFQSSITKAIDYSLQAEKSLYSVNALNYGSKLGLDFVSKSYMATAFTGLSTSYSNLLKSYQDSPDSYIHLHAAYTKIPSAGYFTGSNLVEAISVEEDITEEKQQIKAEIQFENRVSLISHLPQIDKRLYKMWLGANEAYESSNSDRIRHFSTSIRELYTHVLHQLAPDEEIKKWNDDPSLYDKGKPTRRTRLLFICRNIKNDSLKDFTKKYVDTTLAFIDIFQKGTHDIDPVFSQSELVAIRINAETTLKFLLEIHFSANN